MREKAYLVFFPKDQSTRFNSKEDAELEKRGIYLFGFPFDCIVLVSSISSKPKSIGVLLKEAGAGQYSDSLNSIEWKDEPITIRIPTEKYKGAKDSELAQIAAILGRYEEANLYLDLSSFLSLEYMKKYSVVKTLQLFKAKEVRDRFDDLRYRIVRLDGIRRSFSIFKNHLKFSKQQEGYRKEFKELYDPLLESMEKVSHIYEELKEKLGEKKFLVWEMIAEYTIVVLISFELLIELLDYFGK
ncbi:hypothetical protein EHO59_07650 [Leptospira semungkisensis]|uniref:Uncharacterized protein n=1 Tax=Leptospira semungkisensis TaxID=2484985 RepID=A0A4V3JCZ2_9LEPT|nr:hypothetical protein [Leptospira semungkisensis]TGK07959.1 hypothetical protein EHO59_07650 [Leptospira semungkisensis]